MASPQKRKLTGGQHQERGTRKFFITPLCVSTDLTIRQMAGKGPGEG